MKTQFYNHNSKNSMAGFNLYKPEILLFKSISLSRFCYAKTK